MTTAAERSTTVAVLGAGTMGAGIAALAALRGHPVCIYDLQPAALESARQRIRSTLAAAAARGKLDAVEAERIDRCVQSVRSLEESVSAAGWIIEAIPERLDLKQEAIRQASSAAPDNAHIATNTSSLSVTEIGAACARPERFVGLHFFNPPVAMPLIEIVRGERTGDAAIDAARSFAAGLGKETIVVRDSPGFATSRLGLALANEAMRMLETGVASAAEIDRAMELGYRHPMGPLRLTDLIGLDVRLAITEHLHRELGSEAFRPPQILRRLVRAGKLGKKSGEGFYTYGPDAAEGADRD